MMQVLILESTLPCFILIFPFLSLETADLDVLQVQMDGSMLSIWDMGYGYGYGYRYTRYLLLLPTYLSISLSLIYPYPRSPILLNFLLVIVSCSYPHYNTNTTRYLRYHLLLYDPSIICYPYNYLLSTIYYLLTIYVHHQYILYDKLIALDFYCFIDHTINFPSY